MAKQIDITPRIADLIARAAGTEVDTSKVAAYEAVLLNTLPLNKRGTLFDRARHSVGALREMVQLFASGVSIPMHTRHLQGIEMPVGKLFHVELFEDTANDYAELRGLFYLPKEQEADLVAKIDAGVIDEVSVGVLHSHVLCSECGFDFFGEEATFEHIWTRTCANEHKIGENGVHVRLTGIENWYETSLVSRGAAQKPKIVSGSKSLLANSDQVKRLAAAGIPADVAVFFGSASHREPKMPGETKLDLSAIVSDLATARADLKLAEAKVADLTAQLDAANKRVKELEEKVANLEGKTDSKLKAEFDAVKKTLDTVSVFIADNAKLALGVAGLTELPKTVEEQIEVIKKATANLSHLPIGGKAAPAEKQEQPITLDVTAFKTNRK